MTTRKPESAIKPESLDVPFKYGDKNYVVRFSTRAFSALKDHWGLTSDPFDAADFKSGDHKLGERLSHAQVEDIPIMFWAALRSNHPELTIEDVEELVDQFGVAKLQPMLAVVLAAAMPPADAAEKKTTASR